MSEHMDFEQFYDFVQGTFSHMTPQQEERFRAMNGLYRDWNSKINVISRKDIDNLYEHHVLHSLAIARYMALKGRPEGPGKGASVLDLGTGGGFPGIPLAVLWPETSFTLCDSIGKKVLVAGEVARGLSLENVRTVNARVESLKEKYDWIVSRAVAPLPELYGWVKGMYSQGLICLKGGEVNQEIEALMSRFRLKKGAVKTWDLSSWLTGEWFKGKFVIEIR